MPDVHGGARQTVLDLDLDFFLNNVHQTSREPQGRLSSDGYAPWTDAEVRSFLETRCCLSKDQPIAGAFAESHDEIFFRLRDWVKRGLLKTPFSLVHVDAHADLGIMNNEVYVYLLGQLLNQPIETRESPRREQLKPSNWLAFAVACRWFDSIEYVPHRRTSHDLPHQFVHLEPRGRNEWDLGVQRRGRIQMWGYDPDEWKKRGPLFPLEDLKRTIVEPKVDFRITPANLFQLSSPCNFVCLTQSPTHTPIEADQLIPVILEYVELDLSN